MKKLFLFIAAAVTSIGLWADEIKLVSVGTEAITNKNSESAPTYLNAIYKSGDESYSVAISTNFTTAQSSEYKPDGITKTKDYYYTIGSACDMSTTGESFTNFVKIAATNCKISKIVVRAICTSSTTQPLPAVAFIDGLSEISTLNKKNGRIVDYIIDNQSGPYSSSKFFSDAATLTYNFTTNVAEVYLSKQIKQVALSDAASFSNIPSSSQTSAIFGIDVYVVPNAPAVYHTLTWDFAGGSCSATAGTNYTAGGDVAEGATITYPANNTMSREGYVFIGWDKHDTSMPDADLTITAQWAAPSATPAINSQPSTSAAEYLRGETATALSVEATSSAGSLSYQWYSNTTNSSTDGAVAIDGATNASYTPSTATLGTLYYFCAVTNTEEGKAPTTINSDLSGAITVVTNPLGEHTLTWNITVSTSSESNIEATTDIGTGEKTSTSAYISSLTNLTGVGVNRTTSGKNSNTGKIETPASYDAAKYVSFTFTVANGYKFTPSEVSIKTVAVSSEKDMKFEFNDANGSYSVTKTDLSTAAAAATNELDFSECDKAFTGTVTVKIYVYGADNTYRLSTPLVITGTVAAIDYNVNFVPGDGSGEMEPFANKHVGDEVTLPDCDFTAPSDKEFDAWTSKDVTISNNKFTMPAKDVTITATWKDKPAATYAVNIALGIQNGNVSVDKSLAAAGEIVTITATPASGYKIVSVTVNDEPIELVDNKYSFIMPAKEVTVSATFSVATAISNTSDAAKAQKRIENGQLVIEKNGQVFNAMGQTIR